MAILSLETLKILSENNFVPDIWQDRFKEFNSIHRFKVRKAFGFFSEPQMVTVPRINIEFYKIPNVWVQDTFQITEHFVVDLNDEFLIEIKDDRCIYLYVDENEIEQIINISNDGLSPSAYNRKLSDIAQKSIYILKEQEFNDLANCLVINQG